MLSMPILRRNMINIQDQAGKINVPMTEVQQDDY